MRLWFRTRRKPPVLKVALEGATLCHGEKPIRTDLILWPVTRIIGFGGRRFIFGLILTDAPEHRAMEPRP